MTPSPIATGIRHRVIGFAVLLAVVTYMQRVALSQAAPALQADLALSKLEMGLVFSAFMWTYAIFEIPWGFASDRWGPRRVLGGIVGLWSICTAALGGCWNLASLVITRGCFGAFQAGCFPTIARMFQNWLPRAERVRAQGIMWLSARWGGAFTPLIVIGLIDATGWRLAFVGFGGIGLIWAWAFHRWYRDHPRDHSAVNEAERALTPNPDDVTFTASEVPWALLIRSKTVWLLCAQYMCLNFGWQFYITWLPTYLLEARQVDLSQTAFLAGLPLFFGGLGSLFAGTISNWLEQRTQGAARARRLLAGTGFAGAALCFTLSVHIHNPFWAMIALGVASFSNDLVMPPSWGACMDVGGRLCGTLSGAMNMMGGFVAALAPMVVALILTWSDDNWALTFYVSAAIYLLGTFLWLLLDPVTPIHPPKPQPPSP